MNVQEILDRLDRVKRNGQQWLARCPAHDDGRPSLSIREDGDVILLHCFAGCRTVDICSRLGIEIGDLFNRPLPERSRPMRMQKKKPAPIPKPSPELEALNQTYVDALLLDASRMEKLLARKPWALGMLQFLGLGYDAETKRVTFPVRIGGELVGHLRYSPIGEEPKTLADSGVPRQLFPEPSLLPTEGRVWITEGEPDAVTLWSHEYPAVGVPGTQSWKDEWAEVFHGRDVGIYCDADEPGEELAERIEQALLPFVRSVARFDAIYLYRERQVTVR